MSPGALCCLGTGVGAGRSSCFAGELGPSIKDCFSWQRHSLSLPLPSGLEPSFWAPQLLVPTGRVTTQVASGLSPDMGKPHRHPLAEASQTTGISHCRRWPSFAPTWLQVSCDVAG